MDRRGFLSFLGKGSASTAAAVIVGNSAAQQPVVVEKIIEKTVEKQVESPDSLCGERIVGDMSIFVSYDCPLKKYAVTGVVNRGTQKAVSIDVPAKKTIDETKKAIDFAIYRIGRRIS